MVSPAAARRELEDLRAAINYHRREGLCDAVVEVWLPKKGKPKTDYLTRSDAAKLVWAAWTLCEEQGGSKTRRRVGKHLARFILLGLYTGTRHQTLLGASFVKGPDRGWIDVDNGLYYRLREGRAETKKRQPTIRLPDELMPHIRRWKRLGVVSDWIVEWEGGPIKNIATSFDRAVQKAKIGRRVTPHILRHTCATWLMQDGIDMWEAAKFLGMTTEMLERVYGHHHPNATPGVQKAFKSKPKVTGNG